MACLLWGRTESDMTEATQQQQQEIKRTPFLMRCAIEDSCLLMILLVGVCN